VVAGDGTLEEGIIVLEATSVEPTEGSHLVDENALTKDLRGEEASVSVRKRQMRR
jgi:hypothetical protein